MASTKKNAAFLVFLAVFALLTSETSSHLRVGKKAFVPLQNELEEKSALQKTGENLIKETTGGSEQRNCESFIESKAIG